MATAVKRQGDRSSSGERETGFSGRLLLRMPRSLHADLARLADERGISLNQLITNALTDVVRGASAPGEEEAAASRSSRLTRYALLANLVVVSLAAALAVVLLIVALSGF